MIQPGELAPEFRLQDGLGHWVTLADLLAQGPVLLVFYPGDFTPVCTKQLCSYRDSYSEFNRLGLQIVGISADQPEQHREFSQKYRFEFPLLSDPEGEVIDAYGMRHELLFGLARRGYVILGRDRTVLLSFSDFLPISHKTPLQLMDWIQKLKAQGRL